MKTNTQTLKRRLLSCNCPSEIIKAWNKQETRRIRWVTDDATRLANANLIAAAPELLAELHSVRVQLEAQTLGYSASEIWPHVRAEIVRRISHAINKAEGSK